MSKLSPFDYLNSINQTKMDLMTDETEKQYSAYMVNRGLSYFQDTIFAANEMNKYHQLDNRLQYDFLMGIVRKRKRFSKWFKPEQSDPIEVIKQYYGYNDELARQALTLLSNEQIEILKQKVSKGGRK